MNDYILLYFAMSIKTHLLPNFLQTIKLNNYVIDMKYILKRKFRDDFGILNGNYNKYNKKIFKKINKKVLFIDGNEICFGLNNIKNSFKIIIMSDTIETIIACAFKNCKSLCNIYFSKNLEIIGTGAFENCYNIKSLNFNNNLKQINDYAFYNCYSINNIKFGNKIKDIYCDSFRNCINLKEINFSKSIKYVLTNAFSHCEKINTIKINSNIKFYENVFEYCNNIKHIIIPYQMKNNIKKIFNKSNLTNTTITYT